MFAGLCLGLCVSLAPAAAGGPPGLTVTVAKAAAWANLMPVVPPDPTYASLRVALVNGGEARVSGVLLLDGALEGPGGVTHPLMLKPQSGDEVVVPAGQTATVEFVHRPGSEPTPVPFGCGAKVRIRARITTGQGEVGPLVTDEFSFVCAY